MQANGFDPNTPLKWSFYFFDPLSPKMLHKRNMVFNELASCCDIALYDGWDVEK